MSSLNRNVWGQIKALFTIINDYESVSTLGQHSRYGLRQAKFYHVRQIHVHVEENLTEMSNFLCYCIQESKMYMYLLNNTYVVAGLTVLNAVT